jgi:hypothetical protein
MVPGTQRIALPGWNGLRNSGQFAVFFHEIRTDVMVDEAGITMERTGTVAVFGSLEDAREYAQGVVEKRPRQRGEIFAAGVGSGGPEEVVYSKSTGRRFDPRRLARRDVQVASAMLAGSVGTAVYAAVGGWKSIWAYIIGTKLLVIGSFIMSRGLGWYLEERKKT